MTPIVLKTGVKNVSISFTNIDNQLSVYINPDGPQANGSLGWSTVLEVNASGMSYNEGGYSVQLDPFLSNYQNNGATSVTLVVVGSNWLSGGIFTGVIQWPDSGAQAISMAPPPFSSQQLAFTLEFEG
jgi:hypothetical protein